MKLLKIGRVEIGKLHLPGDFKERLGTKRVKALAETVERHGILQPPLVRKKDRQVVFGSDRIAAAKVLGDKTIDVRWCEATDAEMSELEIVENAYRRHADQDKVDGLRAKYAELVKSREDATQGAITGHDVQKLRDAKPGRPKLSERTARKKAAAELGVSEKTIARAQTATEPEPEVEGPLDMRGLPGNLSDEQRTGVIEIRDVVHEVDSLLQKAQARITSAETKLEKLPSGFLERFALNTLRRQIKEIAAAVRQEEPHTVCLNCKLQAKLVKDCKGCRGTGYYIKSQLTTVPKALLETGEGAGVYVDGKWQLLS